MNRGMAILLDDYTTIKAHHSIKEMAAMSVREVDLAVRYVTDASGTPTDILVPLEVWDAVMTSLVDQDLVQQVRVALETSKMIGSESFTMELEQLAAFA